MKKLLLWLFLAVSITAYAQIPSYYNDVNLSQSGTDLKDELATKVISTHTTYLSYTPGVWNALQQSDVNPNNSNEVILIYGHNDNDGNVKTDRTRGKYDNGGSVGDWNREHVFAKSLANPDLGTSGAGADAHNLRPCDFQQNSTRNNRKFGTGTGAAGFINSNGDWYPGDEWKGDVARMIMFMYIRYGNRCSPINVGTGSSVSIDNNMIDLFLQWNADDPVSTFEASRNDVIANIQGNRNPFIDNPAFATQIWGGPQAEDKFGNGGGDSGDGGGGNPGGSTDDLFFSEYIEGSSNNKALEIANFTGSTVNLSSYTIKKQTNGAGSWSSPYSLSGNLSNGNVYVIAHSSASSTIRNQADATTGTAIITFNGNDPVGLFKNNVLIDIIGDFNGGSSNFAQNVTLRRKASITSPNTSYTEAEWDEYATDTSSNLGSHSVNGGGSGSGTTAGSTTVLHEGFFESGLDGWVDGGGDCYRYSGSRSYEGNYSVRIRDNSGTASSMTLNNVNVAAYDEVEVEFYFYAYSMESGEDFWLRYYNGSSWQTVRAYRSGTDFQNNNFYSSKVTLSSANYNFTSNAKFRFQCDASANADEIYIDQVKITGIINASARMNSEPTKSSDITLLSVSPEEDELAVNEDFTIYPNPVVNQLEIKIFAAENASYKIHNLFGQVVKVGNLQNKTLNVSNLKAGMYILQVNDGDEILTKKFMKK
ncbi:endonuclease [Kordia algicida OT-1]|uniref:Extracellular ribonuclease/nuclease fusion protein n=1 Tax=Kordia algicida OT-1 TaxID=391587 RepID=A9ED88_9FLAO|nr:endonuclease [Kordia algicida]EDP94294.1 extracellular ribonuclease/nuclease fusion protein [Kordia algicida OT-1]